MLWKANNMLWLAEISKIFFSETNELTEPKLYMNDHWNVLYQVTVFYADRKSKAIVHLDLWSRWTKKKSDNIKWLNFHEYQILAQNLMSTLHRIPVYSMFQITQVLMYKQCKSTRYTQHTLSTQSTHVTMNDVC
jgi:hypothetical protein